MNDLLNGLPWSKRLEVLRTARGWSQNEAAEKCLTNQKAYWNWENGKNYPRRSSREIISKAFGVQPEVIFGDANLRI